MTTRDEQIAEFRTRSRIERFVSNFLNEFPYKLFAEFPELYDQLNDAKCPNVVEDAMVELVAQSIIRPQDFEDAEDNKNGIIDAIFHRLRELRLHCDA